MLALGRASQASVQSSAADMFELFAAGDTCSPFPAVVEILSFAFWASIVGGSPTSLAANNRGLPEVLAYKSV